MKDILDSYNWDLMRPKLVTYACIKLWTKHRALIAAGLTARDIAEDVVHTAIDKLYNGDRIWNQNEYSDLEEFLRSVIDSLLSGEKKKLRVKKGHEKAMYDELTYRSSTDGDSVDLVPVQSVQQLILKDSRIANLVSIVKNGPMKVKKLAELTGMPEMTIRNLIQKINRAICNSSKESRKAEKA